VAIQTPTTTTTTATEVAGKVLVVLHEEVLGGATLSVLRTIPGLEERGWRFAFWVPRPSPAYDHLRTRGASVFGAPRPIASSVRGLRLPPGPRRRLLGLVPYMKSLRRCVREVEPRLVHANSLTTLAEGTAARISGVPVILHVHEMLPPTLKGRAARRLAHAVAAEVLGVSRACADRLAARGRAPRVVYEAAPVLDVTARRPRDGRFRVGSIGVISRRKGTDTYVAAAAITRRIAPEIEFDLVGAPTDLLDAEWANSVLATAADVGIRHRFRADVPSTFAEWDAFVLPSRIDPCPISLLEAMAAGLPVIGTRVDGIPEQIAPGTGFLVDPGDPRALADAITRLAQRPREERARIGSAARRRVIEEFSIERQVEALDLAYRSALR